MLTQWSQVGKCLLECKTEVYVLYKRGWSNQRTGSRNRRDGALQVKRLHNILAPNGACQERSVDL